jgi:hypothetical protein
MSFFHDVPQKSIWSLRRHGYQPSLDHLLYIRLPSSSSSLLSSISSSFDARPILHSWHSSQNNAIRLERRKDQEEIYLATNLIYCSRSRELLDAYGFCAAEKEVKRIRFIRLIDKAPTYCGRQRLAFLPAQRKLLSTSERIRKRYILRGIRVDTNLTQSLSIGIEGPARRRWSRSDLVARTVLGRCYLELFALKGLQNTDLKIQFTHFSSKGYHIFQVG